VFSHFLETTKHQHNLHGFMAEKTELELCDNPEQLSILSFIVFNSCAPHVDFQFHAITMRFVKLHAKNIKCTTPIAQG
jgi:hypothetical protein